MFQVSKSTMFFTTAGLVGGVMYAYTKNKSMNDILITGALFGGCGLLIGMALNKLYE